MESQLVAEAETTVARWVTSAGGDMQVVDEVPHPAHSQEALGPGRRLEDDRGMRRIELTGRSLHVNLNTMCGQSLLPLYYMP